MHTTHALALAVCTLVAPAFAQTPEPSPKLAAFEPMVGTWTGKGTVIPQEGMPAEEWTATVEIKPILDGFFFQEETIVHVGAPTPMVMRGIYGWDAEHERLVAFGCGNQGISNVGTVYFPSRTTMVIGVAEEQNGVPMVARNTWTFGGDELTYKSERANGAGDWYTEVEGKFERTDVKPKGVTEASFMGVPVAAPMTVLAGKMVGTYDVKGTMTMAPGMPATKIHGTESIQPILGGHTLFSEVRGYAEGDDAEYVGHNYMCWDPVDNCFDLVFVSNMGEFGKAEARMTEDGHLVTIASGPMMGQLTASRSIIKFGPTGVEEVISHLLSGTADPIVNFKGTYARKDK